MKSLLIVLTSFLCAISFAEEKSATESPAQAAASCYDTVAILISDSLAKEVNETEGGSAAEKITLDKIRGFNKVLLGFQDPRLACKPKSDEDVAEQCLTGAYLNQIKLMGKLFDISWITEGCGIKGL